MLTMGEFNLKSMPEYTNSVQEVLKQEMIGQETVFRKQVYELHRLYQTQKSLTRDSTCKEIDAFNSWNSKPQSPVWPCTNLMQYAALAEEKLFRNLAIGSTKSLNPGLSSSCNVSYRDDVDLTLRIGEDTRKKRRVFDRNNLRLFPCRVIDLEASTDIVSQEDMKIASTLSYATPVTGSKQDSWPYFQANLVSKHGSKAGTSHTTVSYSKICMDENFNLGCKELSSGISFNETLLKGKSFNSIESIKFDFDLNKVQLADSFDLNDPPSPFDKLKSISSDEASCSHAASCEKLNSDPPNEENLAEICDVEIAETLDVKATSLHPCQNKTTIEDSEEGDALVQEAAELLFHFSLESSVNNQDPIVNTGSDHPQHSLDSYESLVLKLEETSVEDDDCISSKAFEIDEFDRNERNVMWRRGRRLRDFKDILPSLVALSRHEICEDVGVMEAVLRSREYKRMRSKSTTNGDNWYTPAKCKRSRTRRHYS